MWNYLLDKLSSLVERIKPELKPFAGRRKLTPFSGKAGMQGRAAAQHWSRSLGVRYSIPLERSVASSKRPTRSRRRFFVITRSPGDVARAGGKTSRWTRLESSGMRKCGDASLPLLIF